MKKKILIFLLAFPLLISNISAFGFSTQTSEDGEFGFPQESVTTDYVINASNHSEYWDTDEGTLDNVADILTSWLTNNLNWINNSQAQTGFLNLSGTNANQNIDIGNYNFSSSYGFFDRVGIGTSPPNQELGVDGDIQAVGQLISQDAVQTPYIVTYAGTDLRLWSRDASHGIDLSPNWGAVDGLFVNSAGDTILGTGTATGKQLDVFGNQRLTRAGVTLDLEPYDGTYGAEIATGSDHITIRAGTGNKNIILNGSQVGIGTTNLRRELTIDGGTTSWIGFDSASTINYSIGANSVGYSLYDDTNGQYKFTFKDSDGSFNVYNDTTIYGDLNVTETGYFNQTAIGGDAQAGYALTIKDPETTLYYPDALYIYNGSNYFRAGIVEGGSTDFVTSGYLRFFTANGKNIQFTPGNGNAYIEMNGFFTLRDNKVFEFGTSHDYGTKYNSATDSLQTGLASYASLDYVVTEISNDGSFKVYNHTTIHGNLNVTTGFTGSCVNVTYSGGIAVNCND